MRKNISRDKVALILSVLNKNLTNRDLYSYIFGHLEFAVEEKYIGTKVFENGIIFSSKKSNDSFKITFEPNIANFSKITTEYSCWNNHHKEIREIIFDDEKISTNESEVTTYVFPDDSISFIEKKISYCEYLNNQLIYKNNFESITDFSIENKKSGATEEKMYILPNKSAVKMIATIGEEDYFGQKGTCYYRTNYCDEPNFDTRNKNNGIYSYGMANSNIDEFQNIVDMWSKEYKQGVKSKNIKA